MAANTNVIQSAQIVKGGGPIVENKYKTDGTNPLKKGMLCYVNGGTVVPVRTDAGKLENDEAPFNAAAKYVVAVEDKAAASAFVAVQEVTPETYFEGYVVNAAAADVTMDSTDIGTVCEGYVDANGRTAVNNATTQGVFYISDVDVNYDPYKNGGDFEKDAGGVRHTRVRFRVINSKLI